MPHHQASSEASSESANPSALADAVIDSLEFAQYGRRLDGEVPISRFDRLADLLADNAGSLGVVVTGKQDAEGNPRLRLQLAGSLKLRCQRCLEVLPWAVAIDSLLQLVDETEVLAGPAGEEGDEEELDASAPDVIVAERELAVLPLLEDELLLSLPIAPRHAHCEPPTGGAKDRAASPFAVLAQLKKH